jgi:hypothetical protein
MFDEHDRISAVSYSLCAAVQVDFTRLSQRAKRRGRLASGFHISQAAMILTQIFKYVF